jgi:ubiquitin carboxyl-terminal hydrolase 6/32
MVVQHRRREQNTQHFLSSTVRYTLFGNPFLTVWPEGQTARELYADVWSRVKRFVGGKSELTEGYPFEIKMVDASGMRCCHCRWNRFCHGCPLPLDDSPVPSTVVGVVIDWDPTIFHLSYDYNEEYKLALNESVAELKKKSEEPIELVDCLKAFTAEETMGEEDCWRCPKCEEDREATKKLEIWTLPPVLIIHLKRFHMVNGRWVKSERHVKAPLTGLDVFAHLTPPKYVPESGTETGLEGSGAAEAGDSGHGSTAGEHCDGDTAAAPTAAAPDDDEQGGAAAAAAGESTVDDDGRKTPTRIVEGGDGVGVEVAAVEPTGVRGEPPSAAPAGAIPWDKLDPHAGVYDDPNSPRVYDLTSMSIHLGIMGGGHYVAYGKNPTGKWIHYNDSSAKEADDARVAKENGYCLFYTARGLNNEAILPEGRSTNDDDDDDDGRNSPDGGGGRCKFM